MTQLSFNPLDFRLKNRPTATLKRPPDPAKLEKANSFSEPQPFYSVDIKLEDTFDDRICGEDRVDLSHGGFDIVTSQDYPQVAGLRLPPRFPTQAQLATFRGYVLRNGAA